MVPRICDLVLLFEVSCRYMKKGKTTRPGIREVAKESGYSITTVSMALNDSGRVNKETRKYIIEIANRLGYTPNAAGKALKSQRSENIGLLFYPSCAELFSNAFYVPVLGGIEEVLNAEGYNLLVASGRLLDGTVRLPKFVRENAVDGIVLLGQIPHTYVRAIYDTGIPAVLIDEEFDDPPMDVVCSDGYNGACAAVEHLIDRGHRHIGMLTTYEETTSTQWRFAGYKAALHRRGIAINEAYVFRDTYDMQGTRRSADRIAQSGLPITALFTVNDSGAIDALPVFGKHGIRVPEDLSIVGFDDVERAQFTSPPLTTMGVDKAGMGRLGAQALLSRIENPDRLPQRSIMSVTLIERESVVAIEKTERVSA